MKRGRIALTLACFAAGVVLMVGFEATVTRVLGVAALLGFIVSGVFLIADPAFLATGDEDELRRERSG